MTNIELGVKVHPYAAAFPMLSPDELEQLAASIKANGLRYPIVYDQEGQLLDGRNRLAGCRMAGVVPTSTVLPAGEDPIEYIINVNIEHRHLSKGQQAMAIAKAYYDTEQLSNESTVSKGGRGKKSPARSAAKAARIGKDFVVWARTVIQHAPDLVDEVMAGMMGLREAYVTAVERRDSTRIADERAKAKARLLNRLEQEAPDLYDEYRRQDERPESERQRPLSDIEVEFKWRVLRRRQGAAHKVADAIRFFASLPGTTEEERIDHLHWVDPNLLKAYGVDGETVQVATRYLDNVLEVLNAESRSSSMTIPDR